MDLPVAWNGSAMSRPPAMRLRYDLLTETYGPVCCLEWLCNEQTSCDTIEISFARRNLWTCLLLGMALQ